MKLNSIGLITSLFLLAFSSVLKAHHSFSATYDLNNKIEVEGEINKFSFKNPHMIIQLQVSNDDGSTKIWMVEGEAATRYRHAGWDKNTFKVGDKIRVSGNGTHDGSPMIYIKDVHLLDSDTGEIYASISHRSDLTAALKGVVEEPKNYGPNEATFIPLALDDGAPNLTGAWVENRAIAARPPWGRDPALPYNDIGAAVQASWDVANDPQIFCDPAGLVRKSGFTPHPLAIKQYSDRVVFTYEEYAGDRTVYLGEVVTEGGTKTHMGDSAARYEDNKLIIETTNLLSNPTSLLGNYYSDQANVTEVYTRVDDPRYGSQLQTVMTVTDPGFLIEPWTISRTKMYAEGYDLTDTQCELPLRERGVAVSVPE